MTIPWGDGCYKGESEAYLQAIEVLANLLIFVVVKVRSTEHEDAFLPAL